MADSVLEQLSKTDRNPIQEAQYQDLLKSSGTPFDVVNGKASITGFGTGGNGADVNSFQFAGDNAQQQQIGQNAIAPAVASLNASIPEIQTRYQTQQTNLSNEKQPLKHRYDQLLAEIRGRETSQVNDTTRTANREFARRGITADSTFAAEETAGRTAPIHSAAQSDILTTTFDRESKLRDIDNTISSLTSEMVAAERDVRNTIAQIQATSGTEAANRALQLFQIQQQAKQADLDRAIQEKQLAINQTTANKPSTQIVTQNGRQLLIDSSTGATIRDIGPSGTGTGTGGKTNENTTNAVSQLNKIVERAASDPAAKPAVWNYIHSIEPSSATNQIDTSQLWAIYNSL